MQKQWVRRGLHTYTGTGQYTRVEGDWYYVTERKGRLILCDRNEREVGTM